MDGTHSPTLFELFQHLTVTLILHIHVHSDFLQNLCAEFLGISCMYKIAVQNR